MPRTANAKPSHAQTLLRSLLRTPGSTKPELSHVTGLPASTVHNTVTELEETGIVCEQGVAASNGGRRAIRYQLNANYGVFAAACIRLNELETGIFDLCGKLLAKRTAALSCAAMGPETYTAELAAAIAKTLEDAHKKPDECIGAGVTVPCPVDFETGVVIRLSGAPMWQRFSLASRLTDALGVPVVLDKDTYADIAHLHYNGGLRHPNSAVYLRISDGISAAAMIGGQVFRGIHGLAGEIGHLTVRRDGIPCSCGNTGCLELYSSNIGIVRQYNAQSGDRCSNVEDVLALMQKGDETATKVLSQAMRYLVDTVSTLMMSYDPEEMMIDCKWLSMQRGLYHTMLDALHQKSEFTQQSAVDIRLLGEAPITLNAACTLAQVGVLVQRYEQLVSSRKAGL